MADTIQIKAGKKGEREKLPQLADRELAYEQDEQALYIGTPDGNVKLCDVGLEARKLTAQKVAAQVELVAEADLPAVISSINNLIAAMKSSGVMNT